MTYNLFLLSMQNPVPSAGENILTRYCHTEFSK